jgi:hypothetical protein
LSGPHCNRIPPKALLRRRSLFRTSEAPANPANTVMPYLYQTSLPAEHSSDRHSWRWASAALPGWQITSCKIGHCSSLSSPRSLLRVGRHVWAIAITRRPAIEPVPKARLRLVIDRANRRLAAVMALWLQIQPVSTMVTKRFGRSCSEDWRTRLHGGVLRGRQFREVRWAPLMIDSASPRFFS